MPVGDELHVCVDESHAYFAGGGGGGGGGRAPQVAWHVARVVAFGVVGGQGWHGGVHVVQRYICGVGGAGGGGGGGGGAGGFRGGLRISVRFAHGSAGQGRGGAGQGSGTLQSGVCVHLQTSNMPRVSAPDTNTGWASVPGIGLIATSEMIIGPAGSLAQSP